MFAYIVNKKSYNAFEFWYSIAKPNVAIYQHVSVFLSLFYAYDYNI